ncbi:Maltose permease MAL61 [Talaromyces pinophilus]|nr:Maltose permease MAL61 [Talaromyces pinophilus]
MDNIVSQEGGQIHETNKALDYSRSEARAGAEAERSMNFWTAVRLYRKAILYSCCISLAVIMEGYDTYLIGNLYGMPAFAKRYGVSAGFVDGVETFQISAAWQSALSNGNQIGSIIGLMVHGIITEWIGFKKTMFVSLAALSAFICLLFFAQRVEMILVGYILCGIPWGIFQTLTVSYAADVTPVALRPYLTSYVNLCWTIGQLICAGCLRGVSSNTTEWSYRIPYAVQWVWPIPIALGVYFSPESPWWLVRQGQLEKAKAAILQLTSGDPDYKVDETLAMMVHTNQLEIEQNSGSSFLDCFKGTDLRRTEIACIVFLLQTSSGGPMSGWATYFMQQVGLSVEDAFSIGLAQAALGFVGTVLAWFIMARVGRRRLYLLGQLFFVIDMAAIGGLGIPKISSSTGWATGALLILFNFVYAMTLGPVCYSIISDIPSTRLRMKTIALSRNLYNVGGIVANVIQPQMLNPTAWNLAGKAAFVWSVLALIGLVWTFFRLPESKGLTTAEIDILFDRKISARKFRKVAVDPFGSEETVDNGLCSKA